MNDTRTVHFPQGIDKSYIKLGSLIFSTSEVTAIQIKSAEIILSVGTAFFTFAASDPEYDLILQWIRDALGFDV